ncbi:murein hydrolase activator EnvC family protein [Halalkalibacter alkaliphilus]|uniref:Peptidoglycan DD-metalloendopeptidase family protein n=1 Tax=Halalkalibacter alkaliphilus TaxID=2917993 RepID=A0A9X2A0X8_9BACI|nr:peptidoglycan DD-metalloendopeptidase family protein [Halalkalibacter alkaliphilus]MCL7746680.1 peptidoglycan DD-metalloendopeptidase family protein [Halalkalibacter alkaliphilus]
MKRKVGLIAVAVLLTVGSFGWGPFNETASANSELRNKISDVEQEQAENRDQAQKTQAELDKLASEMKELTDEIEKIDHEVAETNQKVREKRAEIEEVRETIEELQEEIAILEERIAERDELLKERARSMYQSGGQINYIEVILGAQSFSDFLDRVSALTVIAQQDRNILDAHIADHYALEEAKEQVEIQLEKLEGHLEQLETLMAELEAQRQQKDRVMKQLEQKEGELHADLGALEDEAGILRAQERALKQELAEFEAAEERRKKAEAEAQAQAQASRSGSSSSSSSSSGSSSNGSSQVHSAPPVTNSGFMRPATGTITSQFGPRATFGGRMHYGIDIGKNGRTGDVPVVAVQDGTVVRSYYSSSYGNTVIIAHQVNGQLVTTLYAHLENREVSNGQRVSKGQRLGMMGNTGQSFGPHLHFEVHEGGWNGAKSNAVDPLRYIPR